MLLETPWNRLCGSVPDSLAQTGSLRRLLEGAGPGKLESAGKAVPPGPDPRHRGQQFPSPSPGCIDKRGRDTAGGKPAGAPCGLHAGGCRSLLQSPWNCASGMEPFGTPPRDGGPFCGSYGGKIWGDCGPDAAEILKEVMPKLPEPFSKYIDTLEEADAEEVIDVNKKGD